MSAAHTDLLWGPFLWRAPADPAALTPEPVRSRPPPNTDTHPACVSSSSHPLLPALGRSHASDHRGMDGRVGCSCAGWPPSLSDSLLLAEPRLRGSSPLSVFSSKPRATQTSSRRPAPHSEMSSLLATSTALSGPSSFSKSNTFSLQAVNRACRWKPGTVKLRHDSSSARSRLVLAVDSKSSTESSPQKTAFRLRSEQGWHRARANW